MTARWVLMLAFLIGPACTPAEPLECSALRGPGGAPDTPNVLLIVTDDQRASGSLNVMDFTRSWFAENGTRYTNAFATTPLCCPSRSSIFTGRYAHNHNVKVNHKVPDLDFDTTIQSYLQDGGYRTALVGKYLNRWPMGDALPNFDRFTFYESLSEPRHGQSVYFGLEFNIDGDREHITRYSTHFMTDQALTYLLDFEQEDDDRPWFMIVAPYAPHPPATPEGKYENADLPPLERTPALNERDTSDKPDIFDESQYVRGRGVAPREAQLRALMSVDDMVERFAAALTCFEEKNDTLAIYTSDNGYLWGEHGLRKKFVPYTEAVKVPLLIRWPDAGQPDQPGEDDRIAANIDLAPTIAEIADLDNGLVSEMDGESLISGARRRDILLEFWPNNRGLVPRWNALRTSSFQYVEYLTREGDTQAREVYDLKEDPWQLRNLLGDADPTNNPSREVLEALRDRLLELRSCAGPTCR